MSELEDVRDRLLSSLRRELPQLKKNDNYFEGEQPLMFLSPLLNEQLGSRVAEVVVNIPRFSVDVYENRLDIEGFRFAGSDSSDEELWKIWQYNEGDMLSQQAHRESLALSRAYTIVGESDDPEIPLITAESPFEAIHEDDARTHEVKYGVKKWTDEDKTQFVDLYYPDGRVTWYSPPKSRGWTLDSEEKNDFNLCRMVPLLNDPRVLGRFRPGKFDQRLGRSVFHDILPLVDSLNKIVSDMMVSAEFHAMPRRWATGLKEDDFMDEDGKPMETFSLIAGRMWGTESDAARFGQFQEADLTNFHNTIKIILQMASQQLALPAHYLGFATDNPASAAGLTVAENQLIKRAERKQRVLASRWERVQRLVLLTQGKTDNEDARQIETMWRKADTPTIAQQADGIVKLVTAKDGSGRSILPVQQAREELGYSPTQRNRMRDEDQQDSNAGLLAAVQAASEADRAAAGVTDVGANGGSNGAGA